MSKIHRVDEMNLVREVRSRSVEEKMTNEIPSESQSKRRRIMIISGDDNMIDQIQQLNNISSCKSIILDTVNADIHISHNYQRKFKDGPLTCAVCRSTANGYNFDVISCESCKSFFRRNALRTPLLKCPRQGNCDITIASRRRCSACRLARCFDSGMRRERLLIAEQKAETRRHKHDHVSTNETQSNPSPSSNTNDLTSILDQELSLFTECLQGNPIQSKNALMSVEDLQRVESIELLYQNRIELARDGLPWNPSMYTMTFLQQLNSHSVPLIRLLTFFKQIPEFNSLNVDDKVTLIKFNLLPLLCINCTLSYKTETETFMESDSDIPWDITSLQTVYGLDGYQELKKVFDQFLRIARYDQKIIQLALITFILTKGFAVTQTEEPMLNDCMAVNRAQNYYTELLWKYMETIHGPEIAIQMFSKLIVHFMSWQKSLIKLRDIMERNLLTANTNELLPFMKALLHIA